MHNAYLSEINPIQGWKYNPVEFDHVLNCSRHSWAWGAPSVVTMFARSVAVTS